MAKYKQGYYTPKHPEKYVGNASKIRYMSSWELQTHQFFDNNARVLRWSSEEIAIPYIKPTDGRVHKYLVDYWIEYINIDGEIITELVEVKPLSQTRLSTSKNHKTKLYENLTYAINQSKWAAASSFAKTKGWSFRIITEGSIFS